MPYPHVERRILGHGGSCEAGLRNAYARFSAAGSSPGYA